MEHIWLAAACYPDLRQLTQEAIWILEIHRSIHNVEEPDPKQAVATFGMEISKGRLGQTLRGK